MYAKIRKKLSKAANLVKRMTSKQPKMKFVYAWHYKHSAIRENQVLFESFHGKDVSDSPLYILLEFLKMPEADKFTIYFATNDCQRHQQFIQSIGLDVKLVDIESYEYTKVLATSKYLINNSSFPAFFIRREEQVYLQTWHGTPLKTLGKKMRFGIESMYNVQHNFLQANYIMFPNEFTRDVMMEDYNLNSLYTGTVVMNGYPRNSIFMDQEKAVEICQRLGNEEYTTLAYMPTWRGQSNHDIQTTGYSDEINGMLKFLDQHMLSHQKLYVNFHPIVQQSVKLDNYEHIYPFPSNVDKYEFLNSVDALVTDYSSVFFDYSVTRKPVILFMYDYEEYMHDRGMYFDIKELPFRKIYDIETLKDCIVSEDFKKDSYDQDENYIRKFIQYDSMDAGKKMAELIFHDEAGDMPLISYEKNRQVKRNVICPPGIKTTDTIDTLARIVDKKKDIVVFEKRFFNPVMSSYLYDNYPDAFDYVFITKTLPRTFLEEILKNKSRKVESELQEREIRRCFMDLDVGKEFQTEYYHGEQGETFRLMKAPNLNTALTVEHETLVMSYDKPKRGQVVKLLIVNGSGKIFWTRMLTEEEKSKRRVCENFQSLLDQQLVNENGRYLIAFEIEDTKKKTKSLCYPTDKKLYERVISKVDEMDKSALYLEPLLYEDVSFRNGVVQKEVAVIPCIDQKEGRASLLVCLPEEMTGKYIRGKVLKFTTKGSVATLKMKFKKIETPVKDVILAYRSKVENVTYSMDYQVREQGGYMIIDASIDMSKIALQELYWDVYVITEQFDHDVRLFPYLSIWKRLKLLLMNYQCIVDDEHIIFPYRTKGGKIAYSYRVKSKYDGYDTRLKEFAAFATYVLLLPYWKKKRLWLVYEKFCSMAQDNGFYFFKYCMEKLSEQDKKHIYFVLDKDSSDWEKMQKYGNHVIEFMSFRHILYCMVAKLYVASDSKTHLYIWRAKPNLISQRISKHNILFLQHGVTALKRVDNIFGKRGSSPMTHFTTTSEFEQKIVVDEFGYLADNAPILGFTRWDVLEDTSTKDEKIILAMPTWRSWLEEKSADEFRESDYYKNYMTFLQSQKLGRVLKENNVKLIFYIHPKFRDYLSEFNVSEENVELIPFGSTPLNEIIKKCHMLITDYSSVCWDVYYLGKPVLFYQFDCDMYMQAHGSYLNMEKDLFGERYMECDKLIDGIAEYVRSDFQEKEQYGKMRNYYFTYRDNDNSKRTYDYIIEKGY